MKKFKVISILIGITIAVYAIYRYYKFVTSGTWEGALTGLATLGLLILVFIIWGKLRQLSWERQCRNHQSYLAKKKEEYEEQEKLDKEYFNSEEHKVGQKKMIDQMYKDAGFPTPSEQKVIDNAKAEKQRQRWINHLRQAESSGKDVCWSCQNVVPKRLRDGECTICADDICWGCETVDPKRCDHCGHCISNCNTRDGKYCEDCTSINLCGDPTCGGWCYTCDDDD